MTAFSLTKHPEMVLAPGAAKAAGDHVTAVAGPKARVLMVVDPVMIQMGHAGTVQSSVAGAGHAVKLFSDLQSDPKEASVDAATKEAFEMGATCIVGLGGGSALDTSKVVAALAHTGEGCGPYALAASQLPFRKTAMIAMPTTAGTGSETTGTSIISAPDGTKNWFWGPPLKPDMALMDPELTVGLPAYWTFYTGLDALVHAMESRTNRYRNAANDPLAERGIVEAITHLENAVNQPDNIEARAGMMAAAAYAGLAIGNTGCAVAHNIGHALGSLAGVPHGRAVSVSLVHTLDWAIEGNRTAFERVCELIGVKSPEGIGERLQEIAQACGQRLVLDADEKAKFTAEALAAAMVEDANISMLEATARDASPDDVQRLAQAVVSAA
ncbi:iron-containing alcohol dehydrogenase [Pseudahrensia aquimaris]|uniref:Iron-containing alcohol dehydrogenase n=1 Tax=Pseudahrensia aquimaris TaxID=744461 RepID=A0ABW3FGT3_9HYPH